MYVSPASFGTRGDVDKLLGTAYQQKCNKKVRGRSWNDFAILAVYTAINDRCSYLIDIYKSKPRAMFPGENV